MTRRKPLSFLFVLLLGSTALNPQSLPAQAGSPSAAAKEYVGTWNHLYWDGNRTVDVLNADGTWTSGTQRMGTWTADKGQLTLRFDDHPEWFNRFDLPARAGVLNGRDDNGGKDTLSLRAIVTPATIQTALVGPWNFFNSMDGKRAKHLLAANGTFQEDGQLTGFWTVVGDQVVFTYKDHNGWVDTYDLPPRNGVLHGHNRSGHVLTLSKPGTPLESVAMASVHPSADNQKALEGSWAFSNSADGKQGTKLLAGDGRMLDDGKPNGFWEVYDNHLVATYKLLDWADVYDLPPQDGVLHGHNLRGDALTLMRSSARAATPADTPLNPPVTTPSVATSAHRTPPPAVVPPVNVPAGGGGGYFGTTGAPTAQSVRSTGRNAPLAPLVPLATPVDLTPAVGSGRAQPVPTPAVSVPPPTPAPEPSVSTDLTPVGKWHWHSGDDHTLTEKGAVLRGAKVVGQWKWADKTKGQVQVQMTDGAYRAPTVYTLSPHGNHLTGKSPTSGNEHTEDRIQ